MPRVTQYIREEDFEKWKALPNKSEFIHNALNRPTLATLDESINKTLRSMSPEELASIPKPIKTPKTIYKGKSAGRSTDDFFRALKEDPDWEGPIPKKGKK